ncbi:hypothetical protein [Tellurirhabdus bombi]|uniref:hypothetical protein n=1 Tax=Tellurirhabdus bombi TaxID=2907205 RepID=UPI001F3EC081|nr:hypothetical protein [Tellurirhabdus bombi]
MRRIYLSGFLFFMMATAATAQTNRLTLDQHGYGNSAHATQVGFQNVSTIMQAPSSPDPTAMGANYSFLYAGGVGNTTTQTQLGFSNASSLFLSGPTSVDGIDNSENNLVTMNQVGSYNMSTADLFGNGNKVDVNQQGVNNWSYLNLVGVYAFGNMNDNNVGLDQSGEDNVFTASLQGSSNDLFVTQSGFGNTSGTFNDKVNTGVAIRGDENLVDIFQNGTGNSVQVSVQNNLNRTLIEQFGASNSIRVAQNGDSPDGGNLAGVRQTGNGNDITVTQNNTYQTTLLEQYGDDNAATITQSGSFHEVSGLGGSGTPVAQLGNSNQLAIIQTGIDGLVQLQQAGNGNTGIVTQNNY